MHKTRPHSPRSPSLSPQRLVLLRLQSLGQPIEARQPRLHLLQRRVGRGDAPTNVLQLLRVWHEGGELRGAEELLQLGGDLS